MNDSDKYSIYLIDLKLVIIIIVDISVVSKVNIFEGLYLNNLVIVILIFFFVRKFLFLLFVLWKI